MVKDHIWECVSELHKLAPNMVAGKPDILPGLIPVPSLTVISPDDKLQHPQFVTLPYMNNNPISCFYKNCVTKIGTQAVWNDEDLMCGNAMYKLHVMTKEEEKTRDSNNKISRITKSECFTAPDIPAAFELITGATIDTVINGADFANADAASTPTFAYTTIPSNISNVINYFHDCDIKKIKFIT